MNYIFRRSNRSGREGYGTIYARIRSNGCNKMYSTGLVVRDTEWEKYHSLQYSTSQTIASLGIKYVQLATLLTRIRLALEADFDPASASFVIRSIKASLFNDELPLVEKPQKQDPPPPLFMKYLATYIEELKCGKRTKRGTSRQVSLGYVNKLVALRNNLTLFENEMRQPLTLDGITMEFQRNYMKWNRDRGVGTNTIASQLSNIRTIVATAYEAKLTSVDDFRRSDFVPKWEEVDHIYLTPELTEEMYRSDIFDVEKMKFQIERLDLTKEEKAKLLKFCIANNVKKLEMIRDIFIVGCLCGQRISDYMRINRDMIITIDNIKFISLVQEKTKKKVIIPMDSRIAMILDKHNGRLPYFIDQDFNKLIKILAKVLGWTFDAKIDKERMGGKSGVRFCDMISSHTARRTFATNAYAAGVPLGSIMAVTGHSSEKTLRKYLKLQAEEKAIIAAKDFKGVMMI